MIRFLRFILFFLPIFIFSQKNTNVYGIINSKKDSIKIEIFGFYSKRGFNKIVYTKKGKYNFSFNLTEPRIFAIGANNHFKRVLLTKGTTILESQNISNFKEGTTIKGSKITLDYDSYYKINGYGNDFEYLINHKSSIISLINLWSKKNVIPKQKLKKYFNLIDDTWANTTYYKDLNYLINNYHDYKVGNKFYNFKLKDENDKLIKLSDYKGKFLLIYFVSSYCAPCIKKIPSHRVIYNKYKSKGIEILYVFLDSKSSMIKTKNKYKLQWKTAFENKEFDSYIVKELHFSGVPTGWLIDKEGVIIKDDLKYYYSHEKLIQVLDQILEPK